MEPDSGQSADRLLVAPGRLAPDAASGRPVRGRPERAPPSPAALKLFQTAIAAFERGAHGLALEMLEQACAQAPDFAAAHNNRAIILRQIGRPGEAAAAFRQAIAAAPDYVGAYTNLATVLRDENQLDEALGLLHRAILLDPESTDAQIQLGHIRLAQGEPLLAAAHFRRAAEIAPDLANAYNNLGLAFIEANRREEAVAAFQRAIALAPGELGPRLNLVTVYNNPEDLEGAEAGARQLAMQQPGAAQAHNALGAVLQRRRKLDEALVAYRRAIALKPDYTEAIANEALVLLLQGRYEEGWPKYEARHRLPLYRLQHRRYPFWDGADLAGKTILLHSEQGYGDALHFIRYVPLVAERAEQVLLSVPKPLVRLAAGMPVKNLKLLTRERAAIDADFHAPLLSLPRLMGTRTDNIPRRVPYLAPRRPIVERWARDLSGERRLKIGLAWAGNAAHKGDPARSIALETLAPLLRIDSVAWYSLQLGEPAHALVDLPPGRITNLADKLTDFAETAGAIVNLELVISVDTAVIHLTGALARPGWLLLPFVPDWRWMLEREDSPWYPSLRLFRQAAVGDWDSVVRRLAVQLRRLVAAHTRRQRRAKR